MTYLLRLSACLFVLLSFNVFAVDTDGDGFFDSDEIMLGTDPNDITQSPIQQKIEASDGEDSNGFGLPVEVSGNTMMISAKYDDENGIDSGAVYVFELDNGTWNQRQKLTASDGELYDRFGEAISISGDTAVITQAGSAYVFVRSNGLWAEQQKLTYDIDMTGNAVSIDGNTIVIACTFCDDYAGSVYVFERSNNYFWYQQKITQTNGEQYSSFASDVSISGDTLVIGVPYEDLTDNSDVHGPTGAAYVYKRNISGVWNELQRLTHSNPCLGEFCYGDNFGTSVSVSGNTMMIGARGAVGDEINGIQSGAVYVFELNNGTWVEQQKLNPCPCTPLYPGSSNSADDFGSDISIEGDTAVITAPRISGRGDGSVYLYERTDGVWIRQQNFTPIDGANPYYFGYRAAISNGVVVTGSVRVSSSYGSTTPPGSAYVFMPPYIPPHQDTPAVISGLTSADVVLDEFGVGTLIATDVDGLTDGSYFTITTPPANGQAVINPTSGLWTYIPSADYFGMDTFTVTVTDDLAGLTEQVISINVLEPDEDNDTVGNSTDNCLSAPNPLQEDADDDGLGDACDSTPNGDTDGDGIDELADNCPLISNLDQLDTDGDHTGDVCDSTPNGDTDGDGVDELTDNCPSASNAGQSNLDGDDFGDACDSDIDGDGVDNNTDNCPNNHNAYQSDMDGDGLGWPCDPDRDGDGIINGDDNCPNDFNIGQENFDNDALGDECDLDIDGDELDNSIDNCLTTPNVDQNDLDADGVGDVCDSTPNGDTDNDGIDELEDNCPTAPNPTQSDFDQDSLGDACDRDIDGDGVFNTLETAYGTDPYDPSDADEAEIKALEASQLEEVVVPAMGGIGLLALGLSMLGLGAVRLRK